MRTSLVYTVLTRDQVCTPCPQRPASGLSECYRLINSEAPTTALSRERSCAARTRRFLSAAIPLIDSPSTQSATTSHSSLSGEERNIRLFGWRCPGVRPRSLTRSRGWSGLVSNCARPLPSEHRQAESVVGSSKMYMVRPVGRFESSHESLTHCALPLDRIAADWPSFYLVAFHDACYCLVHAYRLSHAHRAAVVRLYGQ